MCNPEVPCNPDTAREHQNTVQKNKHTRFEEQSQNFRKHFQDPQDHDLEKEGWGRGGREGEVETGACMYACAIRWCLASRIQLENTKKPYRKTNIEQQVGSAAGFLFFNTLSKAAGCKIIHVRPCTRPRTLGKAPGCKVRRATEVQPRRGSARNLPPLARPQEGRFAKARGE